MVIIRVFNFKYYMIGNICINCKENRRTINKFVKSLSRNYFINKIQHIYHYCILNERNFDAIIKMLTN